MILKIFVCLTATYFITLICGLFGAYMESTMFQSCFKNRTDEIFFIGCIMAIVLPGLIEGFLLMPIGLVDRKRIVEITFKSLLKRYLPFIVLPFAAIAMAIVLTVCNDKGDVALFMILACHAYFISITALVVFLKMIKS